MTRQSPEQRLAFSVIASALSDYKSSGDKAEFDFLTGKTDIAEFWFSAAEIKPFDGRALVRLVGCAR